MQSAIGPWARSTVTSWSNYKTPTTVPPKFNMPNSFDSNPSQLESAPTVQHSIVRNHILNELTVEQVSSNCSSPYEPSHGMREGECSHRPVVPYSQVHACIDGDRHGRMYHREESNHSGNAHACPVGNRLMDARRN